ncbi:hypothetical protein BT63DRAFT_482170 [Microthyrium microscopicum]|uniref:Uncharacterized protein n=1 Tax=Microthyrium microscopicum TaxID=703497 RepID=A0A6A6U4A4_9PEZI|nr:hypothetical protein BT63DRAFT_482170 [Microthyrium microscopicum]
MASERSTSSILEEDPLISATGAQLPRRSTGLPLRRTSTGGHSNSGIPPLRKSRSRQFSHSSTDIGLDPAYLSTINENGSANAAKQDEGSHWHAFSLAFVALPALSGMIFENGGAVMTDVLILALGCLFLYWSVKWPWEWYHAAQGKLFVDFDPDYLEDEDVAVTEAGTDNEGAIHDVDGMADNAHPIAQESRSCPSLFQRQQHEASQSLQKLELMSLSTIFLSPLGVAYLLHALRPYLSRPSGGLVSNSNLTLFVLAAEVRPIIHLFKLVEARTLHLQKIIANYDQAEQTSESVTADLGPVYQRLQQLESRLNESADDAPHSPPPSPKTDKPPSQAAQEAMVNNAKQSLQPQLDALNRAVRRYEKRASLQSVVLDARLRDLDKRVNDALSLAAVASRMAQRPGLVVWALDTVQGIIAQVAQSIYTLAAMPWRMAMRGWVLLFGRRRKKIRRGGSDKAKGEKIWKNGKGLEEVPRI